ncbi:MAG: Tn3 family transposase, partial [Cyclobacteriaceae bacterium]
MITSRTCWKGYLSIPSIGSMNYCLQTGYLKSKYWDLKLIGRFTGRIRKNKLYFAFRELGRVIRALFLLDYTFDTELRKTIHAATNKSEEFNQFADWLAFASKVIPENLRHEQTKIIKYNHLVANLVILYNVDEMTRVLDDLLQEGYPIDEDLLKNLSPYRTEHINRFGSYTLNTDQKVTPLKYDVQLI